MAKMSKRDQEKVIFGLPRRLTLYHMDQIAEMLAVSEKALLDNHVWFDGRSVGVQPRRMLKALNISADHKVPVWRVDEDELLRWFRTIHFNSVERRL